MQYSLFASPRPVLAVAAWLLFSLAPLHTANAAYTLKILHSFCASANCPDGASPRANLVMDGSGNLFGGAVQGGAAGNGAAFELVANAGRTGWKYKLIHSFCTHPKCTDGQRPFGAPILDAVGNLYGTSYQGAKHHAGAVYMLSPTASGPWKITTLYAFCPDDFCDGGGNPSTGLAYAGMTSGALYDGHSQLFGTALSGLMGAAYAVTPGRKKWSEDAISQFCEVGDCGYLPEGGVVADASGNVFGTTFYGGSFNAGVIFEASKVQGSWTYTVLHDFVLTDGGEVQSAPTIDAAGHLIGASSAGGDAGHGALYQLVPNGTNSKISLLYSFCTETNCPDGTNPASSVSIDAAGNIYGATLAGGNVASGGVVFEFTPGTKTFRVLRAFCSATNCTDGAGPNGVIVDGAGNLFGTTINGGKYGHGTVFELTP